MLNKKTATEVMCKSQEVLTKPIFAPWLNMGELVLLYAPTGSGKTHIALALAHAAATGTKFLKWQAARKFKVLYIEAEMGEAAIGHRLQVVDESGEVAVEPENLQFIFREEPNNYLPNLSSVEGQQEYIKAINEHEIIIIDNLTSCSFPIDGRDDDVKQWQRIKQFIYAIRNSGRTLILVHHAGKSGQQLGTSLRENDMNAVVHLQRANWAADKHHLCMELRFQKLRDVAPGDATPLYVEFIKRDNRIIWKHEELSDVLKAVIQNIALTVKSKASIAGLLQLPLWEVEKALREPVSVEGGETQVIETDDDFEERMFFGGEQDELF